MYGTALTRTQGALLMSFRDRSNEDNETAPPAPTQAVLVYLTYGSTDLSKLLAVEEQLQDAIAAAGVGEFDGDEMATDGSEGTLFMYGPDADALFTAVRPILEATPFMKGALAKLRYGPPVTGVKEVEIILSGEVV
jgi:hypothetical protein